MADFDLLSSPENQQLLKKILSELENKKDIRLNGYISAIKSVLQKCEAGDTLLKTKTSSNPKIEEGILMIYQCILSLYKNISSEDEIKEEHKEAFEAIKEFLSRNDDYLQPENKTNASFSVKDFYNFSKLLYPTTRPTGLDIGIIRNIRETIIAEGIKNRLKYLYEVTPTITDEKLKINAVIEQKALKLVSFQKSVRERIMNSMKRDNNISLIPHLSLYKRTKKFLDKDKYFERVSNFQNIEEQRRMRKFQKDLLSSIIFHCKDFKEFHRTVYVKMARMSKAVSIYHSNHDKEKKKEEERIDKERMRRLMMEDEEGYRKLLDEKKDRRIHYLLNQTDEFIKNLMELVSKHKEQRHAEDLRADSDNFDESKTIDNDTKRELDHYTNDDDDLNVKDEIASKTDYMSYYNMVHTITEEIKQQPSIMEGGQLKEYQLKGLEWMVSLYNNKLNGILADEMGLGKTIQTISLLAYLMETKRIHGPHIVIVPLSTISNWHIEIEKWCPRLEVISYKGPMNFRRSLAPKIKSQKFNVLLTTYEYVMKDKYLLSKISWKYMIVDEGHRMKNQDCKLTNILNQHYKAPFRLLLTGTPLQNKLPELWALLNFLLPNIFNCCTTFEQWFNAPFANTGERVELNEEETYLIIRRLHKILRPFLLRRLKKEVEAQLPDKVEYIIKCNMSCLQRMVYSVMQKNSVVLTSIDESNKNKPPKLLMNTLVQLRKVCNHPFMFNSIEDSMVQHFLPQYTNPLQSPLIYRVSGKFELLDRILPKLKILNHRCLIFCQMTQLMNILEDYLKFAQYNFLRLDGSTKADDRSRLLELFNAENSIYFIFMLSTRAGGLGLNLQAADTVIIFDSDWNPQQDLQAQDRAHRIGQKNEVRVLRLMTVNSIEEKILAAARYKLNLDEKVIQAGMFNQNSTSKERKAFLEALLDNESSSDDDGENEVPDDDALNQMISRSEEEYDIYQRFDENNPKTYGLITEEELPDWIKESFRESCSITDDDMGETNLHITKSAPDTSTLVDDSCNYISQKESFDDSNIDIFSKRPRKRGRPPLPQRVAHDNLLNKIRQAVDYIKSFETEDKRNISFVFYRLPTRKQLPHYYTIIATPVDIYTIEKKILGGRYQKWEDFIYDFNLMISNALLYNTEGSQIHIDAQHLKVIFDEYLTKM